MRILNTLVAATLLAPVTIYAWPREHVEGQCVGEAMCRHHPEVEHSSTASVSATAMLVMPGDVATVWIKQKSAIEQHPLPRIPRI